MIQRYSTLRRSYFAVDLTVAAKVAEEMLSLYNSKGNLPAKAIGFNFIAENSFVSKLKEKGIPVISVRTLEGIGSLLGGNIQRVTYRVGAAERVALVLPSRGDVDSFAEEVLIWNKGEEPIDTDEIKEIFLQMRSQQEENNALTLKQLEDLDREVPEGFRTLLFSPKGREVASNLYKNKGVATLTVFEPYRGTLAYPKTEEEAKTYFEKRRNVSKDAYLLLGELLDKGLVK